MGIFLLLRNTSLKVIYALIAKWYIIFSLAALTSFYFAYKGLEEIGVIAKLEKTLEDITYFTTVASKDCVIQLKFGGKAFFKCIENIPSEKPRGKSGPKLEDAEKIRTFLEKDNKDPYL